MEKDQPGEAGDLRARAAKVRAAIRVEGDRAVIDATVRNSGAGHPILSGLPARRLVLRTRVSGGDEPELAEHSFGRVLVEAGDRPAPFYRAVRVGSDNRIARSERRGRLELAAPERGELRLELVWRAIDPRVAASLEIDDPAELPLLVGSVAIGRAKGLRRPRNLVLEP